MGMRGSLASFSDHSLVAVMEDKTTRRFSVHRFNAKAKRIKTGNYLAEHALSNLNCRVLNDTLVVLANVYNESGFNILMITFDSSLNLIHSQVLEEDLNSVYLDFFVHPQGGLTLNGYLVGGGSNTHKLAMRFHSDGTIQWARRVLFVSNAWGRGIQLSNGDLVGAASESVWCLSAEGDMKWSRSVSGLEFSARGVEFGDEMVLFKTGFSAERYYGTRIGIDGGIEGVTQNIEVGPIEFTGKTPSGELIVGSSHMEPDSVYLRLDIYNQKGVLQRTNYINNFFGFAPTGALWDACKYTYHLTDDGQAYVLGVAYQTGFFLMKLTRDGQFSCMKTDHESWATPMPELGSPSYTTQDWPVSFLPYPLQQIPEADFRDSTVCYDCPEIAYRLPPDSSYCEGGSLRVTLPAEVLSFAWSDGNTDRDRLITTSGLYTLTMYGACDTVVDSLSVTVWPLPKRKIESSEINPYPGVPITLGVQPPKLDTMMWYWQDSLIGNGLSIPFTVPKNGSYFIVFHYADEHCSNSDTLIIESQHTDWYLPNAFSPNNDGLNDSWGPTGVGVSSYGIRIYNRWGQQLIDQMNEPWDGRHKGRVVPSGLYFFQLEYTLSDKSKGHRSGTIMVVH